MLFWVHVYEPGGKHVAEYLLCGKCKDATIQAVLPGWFVTFQDAGRKFKKVPCEWCVRGLQEEPCTLTMKR